MSTKDSRRVVGAFLAARAASDLDVALAQLAPDFTFQSPLVALGDPVIYLQSHFAFLPLVTRLDMISELYGDGEATLVYDVHTATPDRIQRTAEHFRLTGDRISSIVLIFDASPWRPMTAPVGLIDG